MRRLRQAMLGVVLVAVPLALAPATAEEPSIKQLMGQNFAEVQTILVGLMTSNYANVPKSAEAIRDHAVQLTHMVPESAKNEREQFMAYASSLKTHAEDLASISKILMQHDKGSKTLGVDHLRESLAAHYGGMVTTCVACHNRYRPKIVK